LVFFLNIFSSGFITLYPPTFNLSNPFLAEGCILSLLVYLNITDGIIAPKMATTKLSFQFWKQEKVAGGVIIIK
jgi:hypothetical protein